MSDNAVLSEEHEQDRTDDGKEPAYEQAVKSGKRYKGYSKGKACSISKRKAIRKLRMLKTELIHRQTVLIKNIRIMKEFSDECIRCIY